MSEDIVPLIELLADRAGVSVDATRLDGLVRRMLDDWAILLPGLDPDEEP
jgi:hypothetical protein